MSATSPGGTDRPRSWLTLPRLVGLLALGSPAIIWLAGSPAGGAKALGLMLASPSKRLGDSAVRNLLSASCWIAWLGTAGTAATLSARSPRPRSRLVPSIPASATMSPIAATDASQSSRTTRPKLAGLTDGQRRRQRAEMPGRPEDTEHPRDHKPSSFPIAGPAGRLGAGSAAALPIAAARPSPTEGRRPIRHLEDPEWSRAVLGVLAGSAPSSGAALVWRIGPDEAVLFQQSPAVLPQPFARHESGEGWSVSKDSSVLEDIPPDAVMRASARAGLVTLWQDDRSRCLLDLVSARTVTLDGPPVAVGYTLSDIVVELATRRWSDVDEVYLVGFGREMHGLEGVRYLPTVAEASRVLANLYQFGEDRTRTFVVAPTLAGPGKASTVGAFLRLVEQIPSTGAVCCDTSVHAQCTWHLAAHRQTLRLEVRGRTSLAAVISPQHWVERIGEPVRATGRPASASAATVARVTHSVAEYAVGQPHTSRGAGIAVRVLGPVQVDGLGESIERSRRLTELIVYLAFHPEGCTGEALGAALWPERRLSAQTLSNRLHEARRVLGTTHDGRPRLLRTDGRHLLTEDVWTDWSRFEALTCAGSEPANWRHAMSLVRGRPFEGLSQGDWTVLEGMASDMEAAIVDVALQLGEHHLDHGDALGAEWTLRRGLVVAPWDERLYRLLMRASHISGNRGGLESVLRSFAEALSFEGDPIDAVHPETAALYRELRKQADT